jgi:hypothetical protein
MKLPFISATFGQKQTSPLAGTGNSKTFEYEVSYSWFNILGSRGTFMFGYSDAEKESIFELPSKLCNF